MLLRSVSNSTRLRRVVENAPSLRGTERSFAAIAGRRGCEGDNGGSSLTEGAREPPFAPDLPHDEDAGGSPVNCFIDLWALLWIVLQFNAMGCIQSIRCKPKSFRDSIIVLEVKTCIDSNPTSIDESSSVVLRYRTPHFRAHAHVLVPPVAGQETWTIGWIQACNHMEFYNTYGNKGMSSWELPDLRDGKIQAISDSDGVNYPWYGNTTETCTIVGPTKKDSKFTVSMNDNFYPSVTWGVPVSDSNVPQLSSIRRDQSFTTWLVAFNQATSETLVLQTIHWRMRLHIRVDPDKPLGNRAVLDEPTIQEQPQILGKNEPIPPNAMVKPNANDAQVLMWRPKNGDPVVVIPPKY